jgi:transglutaminase-like putative cysteine protease
MQNIKNIDRPGRHRFLVISAEVLIVILLLSTVNIIFPFAHLIGSETSYAEQSTVMQEVKGLNAPEGTDVVSAKDVAVDLSGKDKGYFFVNYTGEAKRVRIEISPEAGLSGKDRPVYDINEGQGWQAYMFPQDAGDYTLTVWERVGEEDSTTYNSLLKTRVTAEWTGGSEPYLYRNTYTYYDESDKLVRTAQSVTRTATGEELSDTDKVKNIVKWVSKNIKYDYDRAAENDAGIHKGRIPSPRETYLSKRGVCSDKAALAAAMLKSIGYPARMIYGYIYNYKGQETCYHAWIEVFYDGGWKQFDPTSSFSGVIKSNSVRDVTKYLSKNLVI